MCGLVGMASLGEDINKDFLINAINSIKYRGPDSQSYMLSSDKRVGFAHCRLKMLDLSSSGDQPLKNDKHGISIIFNGEIYNYLEIRQKLKSLGHEFSTEGDTEVILIAYLQWGEDCVHYLNGMFAFGIFDEKKNELFLARDPAGQKPLYYFLYNDNFIFSSELKALLQFSSLEKKFSKKGVLTYLQNGYVDKAISIISRVQKIEAGSRLTFSTITGAVRKGKYWQAPYYNANKKLSEDSIVLKFERLLEESVRLHLCADVPVGIMLSGGLDSGLIAAMASRNDKSVNTFTVAIPNGNSFDESKNAEIVARKFGLNNIRIDVDPTSIEDLVKICNEIDEPMCDSSLIPSYLICREISKYSKGALSGDGADELFGGYEHYRRLKRIKEFANYFPVNFRRLISEILNMQMPMGMLGKNWIKAFGNNFSICVPNIGEKFSNDEIKRLTHGVINIKNVVPCKELGQIAIIEEMAMRLDFENYLSSDILVKSDRSSMLNSVEIRSPYLDKNLVEFAFSEVPTSMKVSKSESKIIVAKLAKKLLPHEILGQKKKGFSIPIADWLRHGKYRDVFKEVLYSNECIFDKKIIEKIFRLHDLGLNNSERLFALFQIELWRKRNNINF